MRYLIVDASLNGTGIRDKYEGGYLSAESLRLSSSLTEKLKTWLAKYENEHYNDYQDKDIVATLDKEGVELAVQLSKELGDVKVEYYSDALLKNLPL